MVRPTTRLLKNGRVLEIPKNYLRTIYNRFFILIMNAYASAFSDYTTSFLLPVLEFLKRTKLNFYQ